MNKKKKLANKKHRKTKARVKALRAASLMKVKSKPAVKKVKEEAPAIKQETPKKTVKKKTAAKKTTTKKTTAKKTTAKKTTAKKTTAKKTTAKKK